MKNKYRRLWILTVITTLLWLANFTIPSYAEPTGYGIVGENQTVELFGGVAELFLVEGTEYFDADAYYRLNDIDNEAEFNDFAVLFPVSDSEWWYIYIEYSEVGYSDEVCDPDKKKMLLNYLEVHGEEAEFYHEPAYDFSKHKLSWCMSSPYQYGEEYLEYSELFFIREGYISVEVYCKPYDATEGAGLIEYISDAISIMDGHKYEDFDIETDEVCWYDFSNGFLYGEYGAEDTGDSGNREALIDFSWHKASATVTNIIITLTVILALLLRMRKIQARNSHKSSRTPKVAAPKRINTINEQKPFKFRKTYDEEILIDGESYYRKLREEEERLANRYY